MKLNSKKMVAATLLTASLTNGAWLSVQANGVSVNPVSAGIEDEVIDELWGRPVLAYGGSLSEEQLRQTKQIFNVTGNDVDSVAVTGQDLVHFLGRGNVNANMFSSALITRNTPGSGVTVNILTPDNITRVTETQYANAMITAGIADAIVEVASPVRVTGESALTGIFRAYADRDMELDEDRMAVAQKELETTSSIANDHAENEDFDSLMLDNALIEIKSTLADIKVEAGALASDTEVANVVNSALANNNLGDILTHDQVTRLVGFAKSYQLTDAINSTQVRDQLGNLADNLTDGLQYIRDAAIEHGVVDAAQGLWTRLVEFFRNLFASN